MPNDLVSYSRAGDVFHYRWAAKRCLKLIYPKSTLKEIVIEGSKESRNGGEYVIDVSEYFNGINEKDIVHYSQLKHSTVRLNDPFKLSDLRGTIEGFALRYRELIKCGIYDEFSKIRFNIVTNRQIHQSFKSNILALSKKEVVGTRFKSTIKKYSKLKGKELSQFCSLIQFNDREGDYSIQKDELRVEIERIRAGAADNAQVEVLEAMVKDRVLPDSNGRISKEDVLLKFGVTSEGQLFPAPGEWETCENIIVRKKDNDLTNMILESKKPIILHAAGGIGKSVFCQQFIRSISNDSFGLAYDCFGAGSYRSRSRTRHRHQDALVQIANELASRGFCNPLIPTENITPESVMKGFILRVTSTVNHLKETVSKEARLYILIDAADNSEMAASEFNQSSFANELLKEDFPDDCVLVFLCRTERIHLLKPSSNIVEIELSGFDRNESLFNLREHFPSATIQEGEEFHRLTSGNPRVQAYALNQNLNSVLEILDSFKTTGGTVDEQIVIQLEISVNKIKEELTPEYQLQIDSICLGLASLPPFIPLEVLSMVSGIDESVIEGFIADIGRSLWLTDSSVQFRDEPTETWFRKTFIASKNEIIGYIDRLEPLADKSSYISEVLPQLYLQAEEYDKLIQIALSDKFLPVDNPIDARAIRVYRLQFAFKAALKIQRHNDAIKLAMRAGEEVAGNQRQLHLFQSNIDLLVQLQGVEKVQELAFKRQLRSLWSGSENIYTASLLSGIRHYHGEAQSILRSALRWLDIFFEERESRRKEEDSDRIHRRHDEPDVENDDILELATAHLNLYGIKACIGFLEKFSPKEWIFDVIKELTRRLLDKGEMDIVEEMLSISNNKPYFTIAFTSELMELGNVPDKKLLQNCLNLLRDSTYRLKNNRPFEYENQTTASVLFFLEACVAHELSSSDILNLLDHYISIRGTRSFYDSFMPTERDNYLRSLAIRKVLEPELEIELDSILPEGIISDKNQHKNERDIANFRNTVNRLLPWSVFRLRTICTSQTSDSDFEEISVKSDRPKSHDYYNSQDTIPGNISSICCSILIFNSNASSEYLEKFYNEKIKDQQSFKIPLQLNLLRASKRLNHLMFLSDALEESTYSIINTNLQSGPEEISNRYIALSRAVQSTSIDDARVYFEKAVNVMSKFGEELTDRWRAIVAISEKLNPDNANNDELAYRFIRCAELVGEDIREKHWDRTKAIAICTRMSHGVGISTLSRWRERDIGRFEWMLYGQLRELLNSKLISPSIAWALSKFLDMGQRRNADFIDAFLTDNSNEKVNKYIVNDLVRIYSNEGTNYHCWSNVSKKASIYKIENTQLSSVIESIQLDNKPERNYGDSSTVINNNTWDEVFLNLDLTTENGFDESYDRYEKLIETRNFNRDRNGFWNQLLSRAGELNFWTLIEILLVSTKIDRYDVQTLILAIPDGWLRKVSAKKKWPDVVGQIGKRFAHDLSEPYGFTYFIDRLNFNSELCNRLKLGIFEGLSNSTDYYRSTHFFGFVELASEFADQDKLADLIEFSVSRFEIHIEDDYGDGLWDNWLIPESDINNSIAMFIWTALGTPKASVRWNTVHCVRTLLELECSQIIDALVSLIESKSVGAYNSLRYPFYYLHAKQYLLIAFARGSLDNATLLKKHSDVFSKNSLFTEHVIIQKFSSEIALNIENQFPGTYDPTLINQIKAACNSPFPIREENYNFSTDSYFHVNNLIEHKKDFHFAWDFDKYWFDPLGKVFGIPGKQVEDIAADIAIKEWGSPKTGYKNEPRYELWSQSYNRDYVWHDHGSYPKTDNFDFYLSYHSMMVAASKLLKKVPVINHRDWHDDEWLDWLSDHLLTRKDGKWLSDHRGSLPINRPSWVSISEDNWFEDITEDQFISALVKHANEETWLTVGGGWTEKGGSNVESINVNSALVSRKTANSLMHALATCSDPYDYKLPDFNEERAEIEIPPFALQGWIYKEYYSEGLDKFDAFAGGVGYPHFSIGESVVKKLGLTSANDGEYYYLSGSDTPSIKCKSWSSEKPNKDEDPDQSGGTIKATLDFLQKLCKQLDMYLIFEVQINRKRDYRYREGNEEYSQPKHKIFILLEDGTLRSTEKDYKIR